jgi:hypothetical protein
MSVLVSVVLARPEPPSSYAYPRPQTTSNSNYLPPQAEYGVPSVPAPVIHKHVYVHVAPPEPEQEYQRYCITFFVMNSQTEGNGMKIRAKSKNDKNCPTNLPNLCHKVD